MPYDGGVADEDSAEELPAVVAEDELLVGAADLVLDADDARACRVLERVAERGDVGPEELELGRRVGAREGRVAAREVAGERVGHLVAGRDEPVDGLAVERDLADREDVLVARAQPIVDDDAAARRRPRCRPLARELVARADAGRDDHEVGVERLAVGELDARRRVALAERDARCACRRGRRRRARGPIARAAPRRSRRAAVA